MTPNIGRVQKRKYYEIDRIISATTIFKFSEETEIANWDGLRLWSDPDDGLYPLLANPKLDSSHFHRISQYQQQLD